VVSIMWMLDYGEFSVHIVNKQTDVSAVGEGESGEGETHHE
jgi:hypothetical protein